MTIINMGDYRMDEDDRRLRELFRHASIEDSGFSTHVLRRIRRRAALQRLLLPLAFLAGGVVALRPVLSIVNQGVSRLSNIGSDVALVGSTFADLAGTLAIALPLLLATAFLLFWLQE